MSRAKEPTGGEGTCSEDDEIDLHPGVGRQIFLKDPVFGRQQLHLTALFFPPSDKNGHYPDILEGIVHLDLEREMKRIDFPAGNDREQAAHLAGQLAPILWEMIQAARNKNLWPVP